MNKIEKYMNKALKLAFQKIGLTSPNPPVGAVIVKDDILISSGATQEYGNDHAEIVAINSSKELLDGAEMYVTLEPCCHYGKTPPCTKAIIESGIKSVYIAMQDPNPLVSGKGIKELLDAGLQVKVLNEYKEYAEQIIEPFKTLITKKRPHILHKSALTLDGKISTHINDSKWITSPCSRFIVHKIRSLVDGIIIGKGTFECDDPALNVRLSQFENEYKSNVFNNVDILGKKNIFLELLLNEDFSLRVKQPLRILYGLPAKIDETAKFFIDDNFVIFTNDSKELINKDRSDLVLIEKYLKSENIIYIDTKDKNEVIEISMQTLLKKGIMFLLLEGGAKLSSSFLEKNLIDEIIYFIAPRIIGGGNSVFCGKGVNKIKYANNVNDTSLFMLEKDLVYHGYL